MAQVVESKGKTIEDALDNALKELGCTAGDVDYEVLAEPSKGIFGIFECFGYRIDEIVACRLRSINLYDIVFLMTGILN